MIKSKRKKLKYTQKQLSKKLKISESHLSQIENRRFLNIPFFLLLRISYFLNIDLHDLTEWLYKGAKELDKK